ncbi:hypothetical protein H6F87_23720 [Cyanobacteria bacterium FACHB-502]|nr:hypothetical protein [Cyanobacteria bacterium FACHB-502]
MTILEQEHPDLLVDWSAIEVEAQAGDALIKLSVYLTPHLRTASEKSYYLQKFEKDSHLATIFDRWKAQGSPDLAIWGTELGRKQKATLVEAILWRRFRSRVLTDNAGTHFQELLQILVN